MGFCFFEEGYFVIIRVVRCSRGVVCLIVWTRIYGIRGFWDFVFLSKGILSRRDSPLLEEWFHLNLNLYPYYWASIIFNPVSTPVISQWLSDIGMLPIAFISSKKSFNWNSSSFDSLMRAKSARASSTMCLPVM